MSLLGAISWPAFLLLGAGHGINPGMGWLFAVALGLQERDGRAVWRALPPLALGHAIAIVVVVAVAFAVGLVLPPATMRWIVAAALVGFGLLRLRRTRHPRYGGMRAGTRELTIWSFLMATAHGAGLMVVPFLAGSSAEAGGHAHHGTPAATGDWLPGLLATAVHTAGYLLVTGVVAVLVYRRFGLRLLRTAWINLDVVWSVSLVGTGLLTLLL
jgi:hypothetical protein